MQDRPTAAELLADIAELLEREVLPATTGALQHKIRVAGNLCRILGREVSAGSAHEVREVELLAALLAEPSDGRSAATLCQAVVERLDANTDAGLRRDTWKACLEIVRGKLALVKPGHDAYDFAGEQKE